MSTAAAATAPAGRTPTPAARATASWPAAAIVGGAWALVAAIAGASGSYFPTAWGWCVLAFAWLASLALLLRARVSLTGLELATLGSLGLLTGWTALSIAWSSDLPESVLELQRALVYLVALLAALVTVPRPWRAHLLAGITAAIATISAYGLATRLFPGRGEGLAPIVLNRLSDPVGYWNALGIFAAIGALLALGFAARADRPLGRVAAGASLPILGCTLYFTYSRGAWMALAIGLVATVAIDPRRLQLVTAALLLGPITAAGVLVSAGTDALTALRAPHDVIVQEGRHLAVVLVILALASGLVALLVKQGEDRLRVGQRARNGYGALLAAALIGVLVVVFVRFGGPDTLAGKAYRSFRDDRPAPPAAAPSPGQRNDLNRRLFTLRSNGRVDYWSAAWRQFRQHPWRGEGAGTFEQYWMRQRTFASQIRDAHGLYVETLGELGLPGLVFLAAALLLPLATGVRVRAHPLVPATLGAYVAFLAHAGVDWDWEVPAVGLVGLGCGAVLLGTRPDQAPAPWSPPFAVRLATVAVLAGAAAISVVGVVGNRAVARATRVVNDARWHEGERAARKATRWAPWSAEAWQQLGNAQLGLGRPRAARQSLLRAERKAPGDWRIWYDLGTASQGAARARAYARSAMLNPLARDIEVLRSKGYRIPAAPEPSR